MTRTTAMAAMTAAMIPAIPGPALRRARRWEGEIAVRPRRLATSTYLNRPPRGYRDALCQAIAAYEAELASADPARRTVVKGILARLHDERARLAPPQGAAR